MVLRQNLTIGISPTYVSRGTFKERDPTPLRDLRTSPTGELVSGKVPEDSPRETAIPSSHSMVGRSHPCSTWNIYGNRWNSPGAAQAFRLIGISDDLKKAFQENQAYVPRGTFKSSACHPVLKWVLSSWP